MAELNRVMKPAVARMIRGAAKPMANLLYRLEADGAVTPDDVTALGHAMLEAGKAEFPGDADFARVAGAAMDMMNEHSLSALSNMGRLHAPLISGEGVPDIPSDDTK